MANTTLIYLYRDANNFKSHATIRLVGTLTPAEIAEIFARCDSGTYFIPEQLRLPALQPALYAFPNGATAADHAFHELIEICPATAADRRAKLVCSTTLFLARLRAVKFWNPSLSAATAEL